MNKGKHGESYYCMDSCRLDLGKKTQKNFKKHGNVLFLFWVFIFQVSSFPHFVFRGFLLSEFLDKIILLINKTVFSKIFISYKPRKLLSGIGLNTRINWWFRILKDKIMKYAAFSLHFCSLSRFLQIKT